MYGMKSLETCLTIRESTIVDAKSTGFVTGQSPVHESSKIISQGAASCDTNAGCIPTENIRRIPYLLGVSNYWNRPWIIYLCHHNRVTYWIG